jgi:hypothetical protein
MNNNNEQAIINKDGTLTVLRHRTGCAVSPGRVHQFCPYRQESEDIANCGDTCPLFRVIDIEGEKHVALGCSPALVNYQIKEDYR